MSKQFAITLACAFYSNKWPKELTSGVMFYEGFLITVKEFNERAKDFYE